MLIIETIEQLTCVRLNIVKVNMRFQKRMIGLYEKSYLYFSELPKQKKVYHY